MAAEPTAGSGGRPFREPWRPSLRPAAAAGRSASRRARAAGAPQPGDGTRAGWNRFHLGTVSSRARSVAERVFRSPRAEPNRAEPPAERSRILRLPSEPGRSLTNTCSPRRPHPAARRSARSQRWCATPWTRRWCSPRWVRQRRRASSRSPPRHRRRPSQNGRRPPPPAPSTRTAGRSVAHRAGAARERRRPAHRSASRRFIARHDATAPRAGRSRGRPPRSPPAGRERLGGLPSAGRASARA
jgi:hypothetical protein